MSPPENAGLANDEAARERIGAVERSLWATVGRGRMPHFWPDADVRRLLIVEHGFLTLDMARAAIVTRFGEERAPGRSTIHRFWQALDEFWSKRQ